MNQQRSPRPTAILSGLATALCLIVAPVGLILVIYRILDQVTGHADQDLETWGIVIVVGLGLAGGAAWGKMMARVTGTGREKWMTLAGALSIAPAVALDVGLFLTALDPVISSTAFHRLAVHRQFTLIFGPSVFFVATLCALALGLAATHWKAALRIAPLTGLAAAACFLLVNLLTDLAGYRVGGPRPHVPVDLAPMPYVTVLGSVTGALVGGGLLGWLLAREQSEKEGEAAFAVEGSPDLQPSA